MHTITSEAILHELIHDLRQPLGNLETSVFYLDLVLDHPAPRVREQMRAMERQLAEAIELLDQATEELQALRGQRGGAATPESLPLTNSATAVVT